MPKIIAITDLGPGNTGTISAADIPEDRMDALLKAAADRKYRAMPAPFSMCVDGRDEEGGTESPEGLADIQEAGGPAVSETAADFMRPGSGTLSQGVVRNTGLNIDNGYGVGIHGDDHNGKKGCLANLKMRETLRANATNIDVVAPRAWAVAEELGLDRWLSEEEVREQILEGEASANTESKWDVGPEEVVDLVVDNGGVYKVLIEEHLERFAVVDVSLYTWDEKQYMKDHHDDEGRSIEAFVVSIGAVMAKLMDIAKKTGQSEQAAARKTLGVLLFNIGLTKQASAEDTPGSPNASLPVVILGDA